MVQEARANSWLGWLHEKSSSLAYILQESRLPPGAHRCDHSDKEHTEELLIWQDLATTSVLKRQRENKKPTIFQQIMRLGSERYLEYGLYMICPS